MTKTNSIVDLKIWGEDDNGFWTNNFEGITEKEANIIITNTRNFEDYDMTPYQFGKSNI